MNSPAWPSRLYRLVCFPPVLLVVGFFWVGAAIGIGSATTQLLPDSLKTLAPLLLAAGALVGYYAFVRLLERRRVDELGGRGCLAELAVGLAVGTGLFSTVAGLLHLLGVYTVQGTNAWSDTVPALTLAIMAGVTEELLIRALFFRILERWLGTWVALGLSALLFGLLHGFNPGATALSVVAISLEAGILLAAAYIVTRRIWLAVGIHIAWNFAQGGIFGIATSGVASTGYLRSSLQGPVLLSGGAFGAEASVVAVAVCVSAGLYLLVLAHRRQHFVAPSWRSAVDPIRSAPPATPATPPPAAPR